MVNLPDRIVSRILCLARLPIDVRMALRVPPRRLRIPDLVAVRAQHGRRVACRRYCRRGSWTSWTSILYLDEAVFEVGRGRQHYIAVCDVDGDVTVRVLMNGVVMTTSLTTWNVQQKHVSLQ